MHWGAGQRGVAVAARSGPIEDLQAGCSLFAASPRLSFATFKEEVTLWSRRNFIAACGR
jgi:hypothetical protein